MSLVGGPVKLMEAWELEEGQERLRVRALGEEGLVEERVPHERKKDGLE